jgi:hypothetical protein
MFENSMWLLVVAGGPIILGGIIAYAMMSHRRRTRAEQRAAERAVDRLYRQNDD